MDYFLKTPIFAFPALVAEPHSEEFRKRGIAFKKRIVRVPPYEPDAYIFQSENVHDASFALIEVLTIVGEASCTCVVDAKWGNRTIPYIIIKTGNVRVIPEIETIPYPRIRDILAKFSRLSGGLNVDFYAEDRSAARPPLPDKANLINIFPWNFPPGYSRSKYIERAFDLLVDAKNGAGALTFSGTPGRGEFVGDGEHNLVQMIGNNWYLLFGVVEFWNVITTSKILEQALAAALRRHQALQGGARPADKAVSMNRQKFVGVATGWINRLGSNMEEEIRKLRKEIEELRLTLTRKERTCCDAERLIRTIGESLPEHELIISLKDQWRRIRLNPRISGLAFVGDMIQVTTVEVDIQQDDNSYSLGRFKIGINKSGEFYIWSLERLHPGGVPHPHISREGTPCFGNAGSAITDAMREHRYADGIDYLICWLFDGYEDKTASHKVAEWPCKCE